MARTARSSLVTGLVLLCAVAALFSWGTTTFTGAPLQATARRVNVARAGAAKDGPFTPTVVGFKVLMGDENLNSLRNYFIKLHGDAQNAAIDTHESEFGQKLMGWLFEQADTDGNGSIDKEELLAACKKIGFTWMDEKRVDKLVKKADKNENEVLEYEEFSASSPKFLKQSLIKLSKKNGADLGLLS